MIAALKINPKIHEKHFFLKKHQKNLAVQIKVRTCASAFEKLHP